MLDVYVQIMAPVEAAPGSYDWTTIGIIENPESLDIDYLKSFVVKWVGKSKYQPPIDVIRFVVIRNGITEMKVMVNDIIKDNCI